MTRRFSSSRNTPEPQPNLEKQMYEMYPEWGPARHRTDESRDHAARPARRRQRYWERQLVTAGAASGDDAEPLRPDDN